MTTANRGMAHDDAKQFPTHKVIRYLTCKTANYLMPIVRAKPESIWPSLHSRTHKVRAAALGGLTEPARCRMR